jgi:hypothetical protein
MKNIKVGKNKRRDPFEDMTKVGEILERDGRLSISRLQGNLACGYTYVANMIDYLVNIGKLHQSDQGFSSRSAFHRVVGNKTYRLRIKATSPGYSNLQKAVMPDSVLQLAQVR